MSLIPLLGKLGGKDILAVDLGDTTLKLAHATQIMPGKVNITGLASRDIQGLSDEAIVGMVEACVGELEVRNPTVISVVPSHLTITRNMEIPSLDEKEVRDIVNLQAARHTPYAREDIIVDYINMGVYKGTYTRALVVVVSHDSVKRQLDVLDEIGLSADKVLFGAEVVTRFFYDIVRSGSSSLPKGTIHVDEAYTDFLVAVNDKPIFIRSIPIGARHLLDDQEGYLARFTEEIRESLDVYQAEEIEKNPDNFTFTGAIEGLKDLKPVLDDVLKMPAEMVSYSRYLSLSEQAEETILADKGLSFLDIIASIHVHHEAEVDLVPDEVKSRMQFEEKTKEVVKAGILAVIILFLITAVLFNKIGTKALYLRRLTSEYEVDLSKAAKLEANDIMVRKAMRFVSGRHYPLNILQELHVLMPNGVKFREIRFDAGGKTPFFVKGEAESRTALSLLTSSMEESKIFEKIKQPRAVWDERKKIVNFEIKCNLIKRAGTE